MIDLFIYIFSYASIFIFIYLKIHLSFEKKSNIKKIKFISSFLKKISFFHLKLFLNS